MADRRPLPTRLGTVSRRRPARGLVSRIVRPFVFLAMLLGLVAGAELSSAVATEFLAAQEAELGRLLNQERAARGLPELGTAEALRTVARRHSQRMMMEGRIFHNPEMSREVGAVFPDWTVVGENVGVGPSVPAVHGGFMDSPSHRANVLDPDFEYVGIGVVSGDRRLFMTQNFLTLAPGSARPEPARFRLAGSSRTGTARALADFAFAPGSARGAVVAEADDFHGALAGAALAGAVGGPTLLTATAALDPEAEAALRRALGPSSGKPVYLVGGPFAPAVVTGIERLGARVVVIGGPDHVATAAAAARALPVRPERAFVTTVRTYPDALAASAVAAATGWPILYTESERLSPATGAVLDDLDIRTVHIVGGPGAVGNAVEGELSARGVATSRTAGASRIETALAVADLGLGRGLTARHVQLATAADFPDALAGGALASVLGGPVVLTYGDALHGATAQWLRARRDGIDAVNLLGGTRALSQRIERDVASALRP